jgi:hypothetical protein
METPPDGKQPVYVARCNNNNEGQKCGYGAANGYFGNLGRATA